MNKRNARCGKIVRQKSKDIANDIGIEQLGFTTAISSEAMMQMISKLNLQNQELQNSHVEMEKALRDMELKFQALFEKSPIGIAYHEMIYDFNGQPKDYLFLDANKTYRELTGVDPRGKTVTQAFPGIENDSFDWIGTFGQVARTGEAVRFEQYLQLNGQWYDCVAYQFKQDCFVAAFLNIGERKRAEAELQRNYAIQLVMAQIAEAALMVGNLNDFYRSVHALVGRLLPAKNFYIAILDEATGQIVRPYFVDEMNELPRQRPIGKGLTEYIMRQGHVMHLIQTELMNLRESGEVVSSTIPGQEYLGCPLKDSTGKIFGVIAINSWEEKPLFQPSDMDIISIVSTQVSLGIERKRAEEALKESEARIWAITQSAKDAIVMMDPQGRTSYWNAAAENILGFSAEDIMGKNLHQLIAPQRYLEAHKSAFAKFHEKGMGDGVGVSLEMEACHKDGHEISVELSLSAIRAQDGWHALGIIRDITERKLLQAQILHLANHDALTGLPTRRLANDRLSTALGRARRDKTGFAVLFVDLDGFKEINDTYGHGAGDTVLKHVAEALRGSVREIDTVARIGGDEFLVVATDLHTAADAELIAEKTVRLIAQPIQLANEQVTVGASVGIAFYPDNGEDIDMLINLADAAMYMVKQSGGNGFLLAKVETAEQ